MQHLDCGEAMFQSKHLEPSESLCAVCFYWLMNDFGLMSMVVTVKPEHKVKFHFTDGKRWRLMWITSCSEFIQLRVKPTLKPNSILFVSVSTRRPTFPPLLRHSMFLWTRRLQTSMVTVSCCHRYMRNMLTDSSERKIKLNTAKTFTQHLRVSSQKPSSQRRFQTFDAANILILYCSKRTTIKLNKVLHWKCYFSKIRKK